jgi:hypothetical protein
MKCNKLYINAKKSVFMNFSGTKTEADRNAELENSNLPGLMIDDLEIEEVTETKFLGVIIDNKLSWDSHIKSLQKNLQAVQGALSEYVTPSQRNCILNYTIHSLKVTSPMELLSGVVQLTPNLNHFLNLQRK